MEQAKARLTYHLYVNSEGKLIAVQPHFGVLGGVDNGRGWSWAPHWDTVAAFALGADYDKLIIHTETYSKPEGQ